MKLQSALPASGIKFDLLFTPKVGKSYPLAIGDSGILQITEEGTVKIFVTIDIRKNPTFVSSHPFALNMDKKTYSLERVGISENDRIKRFSYTVIVERDHPTTPLLIDAYPHNGFRILHVFQQGNQMITQVFALGIVNQKGNFYLVSQKIYDSPAYLLGGEACIQEFTGKQWGTVRQLLTRMIENTGRMGLLKTAVPQAKANPLPKTGFSVKWYALLASFGTVVGVDGKSHLVHYNDLIFANGSLTYLKPGDIVTGKVMAHATATGLGSFKSKIVDVRRVFNK